MIEVKGLCKFFGQIEAVKNVTLTIEKGEKIVIIGDVYKRQAIYPGGRCAGSRI